MSDCTCPVYVVDYSDPERYHPENLDREDDPTCPVHGTAAVSHLPCPTCSWPRRETVGMICQTCGTDYGAEVVTELVSGSSEDPLSETAALTEDEREALARAWAEYEHPGEPIPDDVWFIRRQAWLRETAWMTAVVGNILASRAEGRERQIRDYAAFVGAEVALGRVRALLSLGAQAGTIDGRGFIYQQQLSAALDGQGP